MKDIHELARFGTGDQVLAAARQNPKTLARLNARGESPLDVAIKAGNRSAVAVIKGLLIVNANKEQA